MNLIALNPICNTDVSKNQSSVQSEQAMRSYESAQQALKGKQDELNQCSKEIKGLISARDKCQKAAHNASLEARKVQHKLQKWEKDFKDASKNMSVLLKQHPWIEKERAFFGLAGSDFDFAAKDVNQAAKRLQGIKADQDKLSKKINKKVMGMIEKAENEYEDLRRKKEVNINLNEIVNRSINHSLIKIISAFSGYLKRQV